MISYKTDFTPSQVDYDESRIAVLNSFFEDMMAKKKIISANYCMARDGKIFVNNALGKLSYREDDPREIKPDTIQWIASITKLFTAVAIWQLIEDGKIRANQPVGEIIPEMSVKPFNEITIAHLLSHTSGLHPDPGCFENKYYISPWDFMWKLKSGNWIEDALHIGMWKKPGEEWGYCSFGYVLLGEVITRVSGQFANDYITEHIIKPCGLKDTGFKIDKEIALRFNVRNEEEEKELQKIIDGTSEEDEEEQFWRKIPGTGGALHSTAYDLCRFGIMLQQNGIIDGNRVLGRKAIEKMTALYTTPEIRDYCWNAGGLVRKYAMGPDLRCNEASLYSEGTFFHEGAGACSLIIDPKEKLVAAWFVPWVNDVWCPEPLYHAAAVMWSGLK